MQFENTAWKQRSTDLNRLCCIILGTPHCWIQHYKQAPADMLATITHFHFIFSFGWLSWHCNAYSWNLKMPLSEIHHKFQTQGQIEFWCSISYRILNDKTNGTLGREGPLATFQQPSFSNCRISLVYSQVYKCNAWNQ